MQSSPGTGPLPGGEPSSVNLVHPGLPYFETWRHGSFWTHRQVCRPRPGVASRLSSRNSYHLRINRYLLQFNLIMTEYLDRLSSFPHRIFDNTIKCLIMLRSSGHILKIPGWKKCPSNQHDEEASIAMMSRTVPGFIRAHWVWSQRPRCSRPSPPRDNLRLTEHNIK